jgi:membrane-associated protease RseP (regulator of RpoE activity)
VAGQSLDDFARVLGYSLYMLRHRILNESCFSPLDRAILWTLFMLLVLASFRSISMPIGVMS